MAVDVVTLLRELDFGITEGGSSRSWLLRAPSGETYGVEPTVPSQRLTAHVVRSLHGNAARGHLLVGSTATDGILELARQGHLDVLTEVPLQLILRGKTYTIGDSAPEPHKSAAARPGWTRWAVERYLLLASAPARQPVIADAVGSSQQSVSNAAKKLGALTADHGEGLMAADKGALLEHWRQDYTGPGGQEFGWYSLDPIVDQTTRAAAVANALDTAPLVSGDVAADRLAPWKLPSRGRIYVNGPIDLAGDGFVPAPVSDATLVTCVPRDPTLWRLVDLGPAPIAPGGIALADAAMVYWDLATSGELDSAEAALHLAGLIVKGTHE